VQLIHTLTILINLQHKQSDSAGYDPKRSRVSDDTMMDFVRGQITGDLTEVPGIGPKSAEKLGEGDDSDAVTNTYQLFGKVRVRGEMAVFSLVYFSIFVTLFSSSSSLVPYAQRPRLERWQSGVHGTLRKILVLAPKQGDLGPSFCHCKSCCSKDQWDHAWGL
jgi:hypothetical protein